MDKYILCLANSYKHGGRCIAGIEVTINNNDFSIVHDTNGAPKWLRPVSHSIAGEVPNSHALYITILSIVKITGIEYAGMYSHSEDVYYESLNVVSKVKCTHNILNDCVDNYHSTIFGNRGKALTTECFQNGTYSVMLVFAKKPEIYIDTRFDTHRARMKFVHNGNNYDLPITDPIYLNRIKNDHNCCGIVSDAYLVLSLAVEHEGWHSKLIAAVIEVKNEVEPLVIPQLSISVGNRYSQTPIKQNDTIVNDQQARESVTSTEMSSQTQSKERDYGSMSLKELQKEMQKNTILSSEERAALYSAINDKTSKMAKPFKGVNFDTLRDNFEKKSSNNEYTSTPELKGCYIATMAYGSYNHPQVMFLRYYRDNVLQRSIWGRLFIRVYYNISPKLVIILKGHNTINKAIRIILDKLIKRTKTKNKQKRILPF